MSLTAGLPGAQGGSKVEYGGNKIYLYIILYIFPHGSHRWNKNQHLADTDGVFNEDRVCFWTCFSRSSQVLSQNTETILLLCTEPLDPEKTVELFQCLPSQISLFSCDIVLPECCVFNREFVASDPFFTLWIKLLNPVASDRTATIFIWLKPSQSHCIFSDIRGSDSGWRTRRVWNRWERIWVLYRNKRFWMHGDAHTKWILSNDWCVLCRFTNTKLVLSTNPEDVLLHSSELAGFEGCVFDCSWQLYPFFFVYLSTFHNVIGNGRATIIPGRVPCQAARLTGDFWYVKRSWRAWFI